MSCPACGGQLEVGAAFCGQCGAAVSSATTVGLGKAWGVWTAICFGILLLILVVSGSKSGIGAPVLGLWFWGMVALAFPQVRRLITWSAHTAPIAAKSAGEAFERARIKAAVPDEPFYETVVAEIAKRDIKPGLWAKAFAQSQGDKEKAKAAYIRLRVDQLRAEFASFAQDMKRDAR